MDRISGANYATVNGKRVFQDVNLTTGTNGTTVNALFLTGVQESIIGAVEAAGLTATDSDNTQLTTAITAIAARLGHYEQIFAAGYSGSAGSFTVPALVHSVRITLTGGGGGGADCGSTSPGINNSNGGGGGAGGTIICYFSVNPGDTIHFLIGNGGVAQANGQSSTCTVGSVTMTAQNGQGASFPSTQTSAGGVGGTASATGGVGLVILGGYGSDGQFESFVGFGNGGASYWSGGGRAGLGSGLPGASFGSGGGGAYGSNTGIGGAGAAGAIVIEY